MLCTKYMTYLFYTAEEKHICRILMKCDCLMVLYLCFLCWLHFFADWSYYGYQPYKNIYEVLYYIADFKFIYAVG